MVPQPSRRPLTGHGRQFAARIPVVSDRFRDSADCSNPSHPVSHPARRAGRRGSPVARSTARRARSTELPELARCECLLACGDLVDRPPAKRLILQPLEVGLPADVDLPAARKDSPESTPPPGMYHQRTSAGGVSSSTVRAPTSRTRWDRSRTITLLAGRTQGEVRGSPAGSLMPKVPIPAGDPAGAEPYGTAPAGVATSRSLRGRHPAIPRVRRIPASSRA